MRKYLGLAKGIAMSASILFSGHMIDRPDRAVPRFPPSLARPARRRIHRAIAAFAETRAGEQILGFASGACGGDILFHEECRKLGLDTVIILPFAPGRFIETSVQLTPSDQGQWRRRFRRLWRETPEERREVMDQQVEEVAYARCNGRLVARAHAFGPVHLILLWNGKGGVGPGGTSDLAAHADAHDTPDIIAPASLRHSG